MFEFDIQSVTDWQRQRHGTRSDVGLYALAIGSGARGLSVSRDSACEEWRHRLYSLVMTCWCVWTVNWKVRVAECTASTRQADCWVLTVDGHWHVAAAAVLESLLSLYTRRLFIHGFEIISANSAFYFIQIPKNRIIIKIFRLIFIQRLVD